MAINHGLSQRGHEVVTGPARDIMVSNSSSERGCWNSFSQSMENRADGFTYQHPSGLLPEISCTPGHLSLGFPLWDLPQECPHCIGDPGPHLMQILQPACCLLAPGNPTAVQFNLYSPPCSFLGLKEVTESLPPNNAYPPGVTGINYHRNTAYS